MLMAALVGVAVGAVAAALWWDRGGGGDPVVTMGGVDTLTDAGAKQPAGGTPTAVETPSAVPSPEAGGGVVWGAFAPADCLKVDRETVLANDAAWLEVCEAVWAERAAAGRELDTAHPAVAAEVVGRMAASAEFYGQAWPWVSEAWERTSVVVLAKGPLPGCAGARACVRVGGAEAELIMPVATMNRDDWEQTFIHELAHVWEIGRGGRWGDVRQQWRHYYAGCSAREFSGNELVQEIMAEAMAHVVGTGISEGLGLAEDFSALWRQAASGPLEGCLVTLDWPADLETAMAGQLIDCQADLWELKQRLDRENQNDETGFSMLATTAEQRRVSSWQQWQDKVCR